MPKAPEIDAICLNIEISNTLYAILPNGTSMTNNTNTLAYSYKTHKKGM